MPDHVGSRRIVVVNGISANRYRIAELGEAEHAIGYVPVDDAWDQNHSGTL